MNEDVGQYNYGMLWTAGECHKDFRRSMNGGSMSSLVMDDDALDD